MPALARCGVIAVRLRKAFRRNISPPTRLISTAGKGPLARKVESELIKTGEKMKTGRDANRSGSYISECCLTEVSILQGQMLPRCPACCALTIWELVKQTRAAQVGTDIHVSSRSGK